jgi:hypothetical protein
MRLGLPILVKFDGGPLGCDTGVFDILVVFLFYSYNCEQDRQAACNITFRLVRATIVVLEKQEVLHILRVCL